MKINRLVCVGVLIISTFCVAFAGADAYKTAVVNGSEIYLVNVASRIDASGQMITSVSQFGSGVNLYGYPDTLINGFGPHDPVPSNWEITNLTGDNTGGVVLNLGQVYNVSQVWLHYAAGNNLNCTFEVSTDNHTWTPVTISSTGLLDGAGANDFYHVFENAQEAQYIRMTASAGGNQSAKLAEISVYTASNPAKPELAPQRNSGCDMGRELFALGNSTSILFDGVLEERGSNGLVVGNPGVVIDLGEVEMINRLCVTTSFIDTNSDNPHSTFDAVAIALSADGETWQYLLPGVDLRGSGLSGIYACDLSEACDDLGIADGAMYLRTGAYTFNTMEARYVMIVNYGDDYADHKGNLKTIRQLQIYSVGAVPEPATMSLLALGGLALLRRKR